MEKKDLEALSLEGDVIDKVIALGKRDVEKVSAKYADYEDVKKQLESANKTLEGFKDYDETKEEVAKYKEALKKSESESAAKIAAMERASKVSDYLAGKKFVNKLTRNAVKGLLEKALGEDSSKGKSLDDLYKEVTDGDENIETADKDDKAKATPPVVPNMKDTDKGDSKTSEARARAVMGLPPKGDVKE